MEDQEPKRRYREPRTIYSFTTSAKLPTVAQTLVISSGNHAAAYLLNTLQDEYIDWKVTGTKGDQVSTQLLGRVYPYQGDLVVILTGKIAENAAVPAIEYLLSNITCGKVVALDSMLISLYIGPQQADLVYLSNPQGRDLVPSASRLSIGNMLKGFSAAALLVSELKGIPGIAAIALVPDHVLTSSTCRFYESFPLYPPSVQGYVRGIAATEQSIYSHNLYS